jgi:hypothetical protein
MPDLLRPFIWSRVSGLMRFRELRQIASENATFFTRLSLMTRTGFTVMTLRQSNNPPNGKVETHQDRKRRDRLRAKSRACSSISLTSSRLFTKNSSWHAKRSIPHTVVTFYGDCVKMCDDFAQKFGDKTIDCCNTTMLHLTLPFRQRISSLFSISPIEHKTEVPPF